LKTPPGVARGNIPIVAGRFLQKHINFLKKAFSGEFFEKENGEKNQDFWHF